MTELIAMLTTGKGSWSHVNSLIKDNRFDRIFLLTNDFGKEKFQPDEKTELILLDLNKPVEELAKDIVNSLKDKISGQEIGINFISGNGIEHMALMSAVLKLGVGFRLVALTKQGVEEV
ncbi:MAG: hypothetical protein ABII01_01465 [Candidatus Woesearchaeota archaeon]